MTEVHLFRQRFTLVERILIVVAITSLLAAMAVPGFLRANKRWQTSRILNDLRMIDSAIHQNAAETNREKAETVAASDWANYLKKGSLIYNTGKGVSGNAYSPQTVDSVPQVATNDYNALSDVAGNGFWSPYGP